MANTIGKLIGLRRHSFNIKNDYGDKVSLSINIDFSSASDEDIKNWLVANRVIAGQRPWRKLSVEELNDLNGTTFIAQNIGQKVKSRSEQIQQFANAFMSAGIDEVKANELARAAVDNPSALAIAKNKVDYDEVEELEE